MKYAKILVMDKNTERYKLTIAIWEKYNVLPRRVEKLIVALQAVQSSEYDLIVLAEEKGSDELVNSISLFRNLTNKPIIIYADHVLDIQYQIQALKEGADFVWTIPNEMELAVALGFAIIRRSKEYELDLSRNSCIEQDNLLINIDHRIVQINGQEIKLSRKEFDFLTMLVSSPRYVYSYDNIFGAIWGEDYISNSKYPIWNKIARIRSKIRKINPMIAEQIITVPGVGYSYIPKIEK